ncbi:hypothetical protein ON010_g14086 [Phytophthora cinnamomi]|nr:hypothetical protein ON010_g14086 [Phytophthora cinnamomi]
MENTITRFSSGLDSVKLRSKNRIYYSWKTESESIKENCVPGGATLPVTAEEQLVRLAISMQILGFQVEVSQLHGHGERIFVVAICWRLVGGRGNAKQLNKMQGRRWPSSAANGTGAGVNYEYVPTATVNGRCIKMMWMQYARKSKERMAAMQPAGSEGNKADPFLIFNTRPFEVAGRERETTVFRHGFGHQLGGELKAEQATQGRAHEGPSRLLVYVASNRCGLEPRLKEQLRKHWIEFLLDQVRSTSRGSLFKMAAPSRPHVTKWIKYAGHL